MKERLKEREERLRGFNRALTHELKNQIGAALGAAEILEIPGIGEAMRSAGRAVTPLADLSRSFGGAVGRTLVVCLPGSPRGALESLAAIEDLLGHALETLAGPFDHAPGRAHGGDDRAHGDDDLPPGHDILPPGTAEER